MELTDYILKVRSKLMEVDESVEISEADIVTAIHSAASFHSRFKPHVRVEDLDPSGTYDIAVPDTWDNSLSSIISIEYPTGNQEASYISSSDYTVYRSPSGTFIRFLGTTPTSAIRVTFTSPHVVTESEVTFTDGEFEAVVYLCAAIAARALGARYLRPWDNTLSADFINFGQKAEQYFAFARQLETMWRVAAGIGEKGGYGPALAVGNWTTRLSTNHPLMSHGKRY